MRFWFDQDVALETDFVLMLDDHLQEAPKLSLFLLKVGIEQTVIAFATTPQHIVRAAQAMRCLDTVAHLRRCETENVGIGIGRCTAHIAGVAEHVRGAPKQLHAGSGHLGFDLVDDDREITHMFVDRFGMGHHINVVEAEIGQPEAGEKFERFVQLMVRTRLVNGSTMPGTVERAGAKDIESVPAECMPIANRHP